MHAPHQCYDMSFLSAVKQQAPTFLDFEPRQSGCNSLSHGDVDFSLSCLLVEKLGCGPPQGHVRSIDDSLKFNEPLAGPVQTWVCTWMTSPSNGD